VCVFFKFIQSPVDPRHPCLLQAAQHSLSDHPMPASPPCPHRPHAHIALMPTSPSRPHRPHAHIALTPTSPSCPHRPHAHIALTPTSPSRPHRPHAHIALMPTSPSCMLLRFVYPEIPVWALISPKLLQIRLNPITPQKISTHRGAA
jgi:hypothetical protein